MNHQTNQAIKPLASMHLISPRPGRDESKSEITQAHLTGRRSLLAPVMLQKLSGKINIDLILLKWQSLYKDKEVQLVL